MLHILSLIMVVLQIDIFLSLFYVIWLSNKRIKLVFPSLTLIMEYIIPAVFETFEKVSNNSILGSRTNEATQSTNSNVS